MVQLKLSLGSAERDCPLWAGCAAPLCPLSPDLARAVWFPSEPICRSESYSGLRWVRIQAEIARLPGRKHRGYFTIGMLRAIRQVGPGLSGKKDDEGPKRQHASAVRKRSQVRPLRGGRPVKQQRKRGQQRGRAPIKKTLARSLPTARNTSADKGRRGQGAARARQKKR